MCVSPVLLLNINRIEFDPERCGPVKLNNMFEFPEECKHVFVCMCLCMCVCVCMYTYQERCEHVKLNNRFEFPEECAHVCVYVCMCLHVHTPKRLPSCEAQ